MEERKNQNLLPISLLFSSTSSHFRPYPPICGVGKAVVSTAVISSPEDCPTAASLRSAFSPHLVVYRRFSTNFFRHQAVPPYRIRLR